MPRMQAPASGVKVRMYRQGHGDCFLLAFRAADGQPFYLLIDCGYQSGSEVHHGIEDVVKDIGDSTGNHLHAVLITHEHEDHVNGFWSKTGGTVVERFKKIAVDQLWLAWTEDPADDFANSLRRRYGDTLIGLLAANEQMAGASDPEIRAVRARVQNLLSLEVEGDGGGANPTDRDERLGLAVKGETNKRAIAYIKDKTGQSPLYLRPDHREPYSLPGVPGVGVYALGPPRKEKLLLSLDPVGAEGYARLVGMTADAASFLTAAVGNSSNPALTRLQNALDATQQPFSARYRIPDNRVDQGPYAGFFRDHYGAAGAAQEESWRRIDHDWLRTSETLALRLNNEVNNTCLVVAIELPNTRKVLLFAGDAQRGNWISWDDQQWVGPTGTEVKAKDLLARTVLYKVGHHGSHNATLKGYCSSDYPNLGWMAQGDFQDDFVAMIPANRDWAYRTAHWSHPLPSIEQALSRKARGKVFRIDVDKVARSPSITPAEWQEFQSRTVETDLYFEHSVPD